MDPACECSDKTLVKRQYANGATQFGTQCQTCGKWAAVSKSKLAPGEMTFAGEFDDSIGERFWSEWRAKQQDEAARQRAEQSRAWWAAYTAYLLTQRWEDKRQRCLERDGHMCQACLRRKATQVHHLTYEHCQNAQGEFGYEPLFDLASICDLCHEAFHQISREKRTYANSN